MHKLILFTTALALISACARPCPDDINLGSVSFSEATKSFLPAGQLVDKMSFTNSANGNKLEFTNQSGALEIDRYQLDVETLCERGDFLDKTVQTNYFNAHSLHLYYTTADNSYTLAVDAQIENNGPYGERKDTVLYETFACWGQKLTTPTQTGSIQLLAADRGNTTQLASFKAGYEKYRFLADTTLGNRNLSNIWLSNVTSGSKLVVYYSKSRGIEAFSTPDDLWLRN